MQFFQKYRGSSQYLGSQLEMIPRSQKSIISYTKLSYKKEGIQAFKAEL